MPCLGLSCRTLHGASFPLRTILSSPGALIPLDGREGCDKEGTPAAAIPTYLSQISSTPKCVPLSGSLKRIWGGGRGSVGPKGDKHHSDNVYSPNRRETEREAEKIGKRVIARVGIFTTVRGSLKKPMKKQAAY